MRLKAYLLLGVATVVVAAALILVLTNLDRDWTLHVYYRDVTLHRGAVLFGSAVAGTIIYLLMRICIPSGLRAWRSSAETRRRKATEERLASLEAPPPKK